MKSKTNKIKSILGITMGSVVALSAVPAINLANIGAFKAGAKEVTSNYTSTSVNLTNADFTGSTVGKPEAVNGWSVDYAKLQSSDKTTGRTNATTFGGIVNTTNYEVFKNSYNRLLTEGWLASIKDSNKDLYSAINTAIDSETNKDVNNIGAPFALPTNEADMPVKYLYYSDEKSSNYNLLQNTEISSEFTNEGGKKAITYNEKEFVLKDKVASDDPDVYTYKAEGSDVTEKIVKGGKVLMLSAGTNLVNSTGETPEVKLDGSLGEREVYYSFAQGFQLLTYSYYKISVLVKTDNGATASIALAGDLNKNEDGKFKNLSTVVGEANPWTEYTFYISTGYGASGKYSVNLNLSIGSEDTYSKGQVYFDNVSVKQIQYSEFASATANSTTKIVKERDSYQVVTEFDEATFAQTGWSITPRENGVEDEQYQLIEEKNHNGNSTFETNNKALLVENTDTKNAIQFVTKKVKVDPMKFYRITLWSRTNYNYANSKTATFTVQVNGTLNEKTVSAKEAKITTYNADTTKANPSHVNNFWTQSAFYVQGCPLYQTEVWLTITIPASSSFLLDQFAIEEVTSDEYSATSNTKLALTSSLPSDSGKITNGHFFYINSENTPSGLYNPQSWDLAIGTKTKQTVYSYYNNENNQDYTSVLKVGETTKEGITLTDNETSITYNDGSAEKIFNRVDDTNTYTYTAIGSEITEKIVITNDVEFTYDPASKKLINKDFPDEKFDVTDFIYGMTLGTNYDNSLTGTTSTATDVNKDNFPENYLVINNKSTSTEVFNKLTYTSSKFSVASNAYKLVTVTLFSELQTTDGAKLNLLNSTGEIIASMPIKQNEAEWKTYNFYVQGGVSAYNLNLQIEYGKNDAQVNGAILIKTATTTSSTATTFNNKANLSVTANEYAYSRTVNLSGTEFSELGDNIEGDKYTALNFDKSTASTGEAYILHTHSTDENYNTDFKAIYENYVNLTEDEKPSENPYVLVLKNTAGQSTTLTGKQKFSLSSSSYYKLTITAKALGLTEGTSGTFKLTNVDKTFDINSTDFTTYTLYFATGKDAITTQTQFQLLNAEGEIIIDSVKLETLTESNFKTAIEDLEEDTTTAKVVDLRTAKANTDNEEVPDITEEDNTLEILFATLSSLLLVAALIIALVFTRIKTKKKGKKSTGKNNYKPSNSNEDNEQKGFV